MRWGSGAAAVIGLWLAASLPAQAEPPGFFEAQQAFESQLDANARQLLQVWLIAGGYMNSVPNERFSTRTFKALQTFEFANGFVASDQLDKPEIERLAAIVRPMFEQWGLRKITLPGHAATVWVPFGLDLETRATDKGYRYHDRAGRFDLALLALPNVSMDATLAYLLDAAHRDGTTVHYWAKKAGWFVLSTTTADKIDHYRRYHQDGAFLTGFAMDWNNAAGNIKAERIAVLDSAILAASLAGEPFIDPPDMAPPVVARAEPPAETRPITVPVAPPPAPEEKHGFSSGTGFFVTDVGHLVTNAHVVKGCTDIAIKQADGTIGPAVELATDEANDLALLKVKATPARVATIRPGIRLGEGVEAFGFPHSDVLSSSGNFTLGNVTALTGLRDDVRYLQISAPVQAGNSGGPLLDGSGNLVGVVSAKLDAVKMMLASGDLPENVNFAVKSGMVAAFLDANRVTYKTGTPATTPLQPADIADQARAMSVFVVCR